MNWIRQPEAHVGPGWVVNLRLGEDWKSRLVHDQPYVRIRVVGGQVYEAAIDSAFGRIAAANSLDYSLRDLLACILDFHNGGRDGHRRAFRQYGTIELDVQGG